MGSRTPSTWSRCPLRGGARWHVSTMRAVLGSCAAGSGHDGPRERAFLAVVCLPATTKSLARALVPDFVLAGLPVGQVDPEDAVSPLLAPPVWKGEISPALPTSAQSVCHAFVPLALVAIAGPSAREMPRCCHMRGWTALGRTGRRVKVWPGSRGRWTRRRPDREGGGALVPLHGAGSPQPAVTGHGEHGAESGRWRTPQSGLPGSDAVSSGRSGTQAVAAVPTTTHADKALLWSDVRD